MFIKRSTLILLTAAAAALLAGCAGAPAPKSGMLTYDTKPEGAMLFEGGQSIGQAPVTRTYAAQGTSSSIRTPLVTAVWPSGAKDSYYTIMPVGADLVATIERPAGAPGLQADLDTAKKLAADRDQQARRNKDATLRDVARASDRCKRQQSGQSLAVQDDCS